jgi:hypothetical protein
MRSAGLEGDDSGIRSSRNRSALERGADVKSKSRNGQTPLSWAARSGYEAVVKLLLEKGADIEVQIQGWPDVTIVDCRERARGGCEAAAREGGRETSTLEGAEKVLSITSSSEALVLSLTVSSVPCNEVSQPILDHTFQDIAGAYIICGPVWARDFEKIVFSTTGKDPSLW